MIRFEPLHNLLILSFLINVAKWWTPSWSRRRWVCTNWSKWCDNICQHHDHGILDIYWVILISQSHRPCDWIHRTSLECPSNVSVLKSWFQPRAPDSDSIPYLWHFEGATENKSITRRQTINLLWLRRSCFALAWHLLGRAGDQCEYHASHWWHCWDHHGHSAKPGIHRWVNHHHRHLLQTTVRAIGWRAMIHVRPWEGGSRRVS